MATAIQFAASSFNRSPMADAENNRDSSSFPAPDTIAYLSQTGPGGGSVNSIRAATPGGIQDISPQRPLSTGERIFLIGEVAFLFGHTPSHHGYTIADLANFVATPIQLNQFRIYRTPERPVGFVAWASLTEETAEAYLTDARELQPADWNAGSQLWFIEFIAPFGHARRMAKDLRRNVLPSAHVRSLRRYRDGSTRVVDWYGADYQG